jgi:protein-tyrosine phosphatase
MHVTFVCEANQARSPVAAALFTAELGLRPDAGAWRVDSAGVFATADVPAMPEMQDLARARGLDLSGHRSRGLDDHATAVADLLLTMTREQADLIGARTTGVVTRCFVLDELVALLTSVRDEPVPTGDPDGRIAVIGLPPTPRARVAAAHARRPFRRPQPDDDVADPVTGSGVRPDQTFERLLRSVTDLAALLLDADGRP